MTTQGMQNPFSRFGKDFSEMYDVVRTVIAARHRRLYKIEVLKDHTAPALFKVHFSLQERLVVRAGNSRTKAQFKKVWVEVTLPWVEAHDADSALTQALLLLSQVRS
jgi:hypothetical protein